MIPSLAGHNDEREALVIVHVAVLWFLPTVLVIGRPIIHARHQKTGGGRRDRTDDLLLAKQALSQLSYAPDRPSISGDAHDR